MPIQGNITGSHGYENILIKMVLEIDVVGVAIKKVHRNIKEYSPRYKRDPTSRKRLNIYNICIVLTVTLSTYLQPFFQFLNALLLLFPAFIISQPLLILISSFTLLFQHHVSF